MGTFIWRFDRTSGDEPTMVIASCTRGHAIFSAEARQVSEPSGGFVHDDTRCRAGHLERKNLEHEETKREEKMDTESASPNTTPMGGAVRVRKGCRGAIQELVEDTPFGQHDTRGPGWLISG